MHNFLSRLKKKCEKSQVLAFFFGSWVLSIQTERLSVLEATRNHPVTKKIHFLAAMNHKLTREKGFIYLYIFTKLKVHALERRKETRYVC